MTVAELKQQLDKYDDSTEVVYNDSDYWHCDINRVRLTERDGGGDKVVELSDYKK